MTWIRVPLLPCLLSPLRTWICPSSGGSTKAVTSGCTDSCSEPSKPRSCPSGWVQCWLLDSPPSYAALALEWICPHTLAFAPG